MRRDIMEVKNLEFAAKVTKKIETPDGRIRPKDENKKAKEYAFNEIKLLAGLAHRNVVCL